MLAIITQDSERLLPFYKYNAQEVFFIANFIIFLNYFPKIPKVRSDTLQRLRSMQ